MELLTLVVGRDAPRFSYSCRRSSAAIELDARVSLRLASRLEPGDARKRRSAQVQRAARFQPLGLVEFIVKIADGAKRGEASRQTA
jgi:hypothetical protein